MIYYKVISSSSQHSVNDKLQQKKYPIFLSFSSGRFKFELIRGNSKQADLSLLSEEWGNGGYVMDQFNQWINTYFSQF